MKNLKTSSLLDQLGASMTKSTTPAAAPGKVPAKDSGVGKPQSSKAIERAKVKNFSLYVEDLEKIKEIQSAIFDGTENFPNASLALRIALRSCELDRSKLLKIYEDIKNQDSRLKS